DDSGGPEWNPEHLDTPDDRANEEAEEIDVDRQHEQDADPIQLAEQVALDPVVRRSLSVLLEHAWLTNGLAIVERTLEDDVAEALDEGAMRIAFAIGKCVVLAMAGDPFFRDDGGGQPEPDPHRQRRDIVELHAAMRLVPMKEQSDAHVGEVARDDN